MKRNESLRTFEGAVAIVTGGASGIGSALAEALARRGARVVMADLQAELAEEAAARIRQNGGQATAEELDVTDFPATNRLVESAFQTGDAWTTSSTTRALVSLVKRAIERSPSKPLQPTGAASSVCSGSRPPEGGPGG